MTVTTTCSWRSITSKNASWISSSSKVVRTTGSATAT